LALSFVVGGWARELEDYFGGLDKMYHTHHAFGLTAVGLLTVHPVALAPRFVPDHTGSLKWWCILDRVTPLFARHARPHMRPKARAFGSCRRY